MSEKPIDYTARFERHADAFYRETGLMAPGKSVPLEMGGQDDERRQCEWEAWKKRLPVDCPYCPEPEEFHPMDLAILGGDPSL